MRGRSRGRPLPARGEAWEQARMRALVRDDLRCQHPGCDEMRLRWLEVHHRIPRAEGGTHDLDNLITLCRRHHAEHHPHLARELARDDDTLPYPWREL